LVKQRRWNISTKIDSILLGDNPFFGVDHLSLENARAKKNVSQDFNNIIDVIKFSSHVGVDGMVVSTHPRLKDLLDHMATTTDLLNKITFHPIIPYIQGYVLKINEKGIIKVLMDILNPPTSLQNRIKIITKGSIGAIRKDIFELFKLFVDLELLQLRDAKINTVFLHDVFTELALSLNLKSIFQSFQEHLREEYGVEAGLVTKNFPLLVDRLEDWNLTFSTIMTSFNRVGFQMNPSKRSCEHSLLKYDGKVIAMSVLAGGFLEPNEAYSYILSQPKIRSVVIGISSVSHAKKTFEIFLNKEIA
jgi:hypothetical protein